MVWCLLRAAQQACGGCRAPQARKLGPQTPRWGRRRAAGGGRMAIYALVYARKPGNKVRLTPPEPRNGVYQDALGSLETSCSNLFVIVYYRLSLRGASQNKIDDDGE